MRCPVCGWTGSKVVDTQGGRIGEIKRRRQCLKCSLRFNTIEVEEEHYEILLEKAKAYDSLEVKGEDN